MMRKQNGMILHGNKTYFVSFSESSYGNMIKLPNFIINIIKNIPIKIFSPSIVEEVIFRGSS